MFKARKRYCIIASILFVGALWAIFGSSPFYIHYNGSDSLPQTWWIGTPCRQDPNREDYVLFFHSRSEQPVLKQVKGIAGDRIWSYEGIVWVNGECIGTARELAPSGMPVEMITPQIIPNGYLFVAGEHPDSFDSRYKEFGLVSIAVVEEVLCPIF